MLNPRNRFRKRPEGLKKYYDVYVWERDREFAIEDMGTPISRRRPLAELSTGNRFLEAMLRWEDYVEESTKRHWRRIR